MPLLFILSVRTLSPVVYVFSLSRNRPLLKSKFLPDKHILSLTITTTPAIMHLSFYIFRRGKKRKWKIANVWDPVWDSSC